MADITKVYSFVEEVADGTHIEVFDAGGGTDTLRYTLSNVTPDLSWDVLADITDETTVIADVESNSSETWPFDAVNVATVSNGTITVAGADATVTATGTVTTFRYVWLYNDTPTSPANPLIGYWDNGSAVDLTTGQVFTHNLDADELIVMS